MSKLDDIIFKLMLGESSYKLMYKIPGVKEGFVKEHPEAPKAKQQIKDLMLELIGDTDETPVFQNISELEHAVINGQNGLRHELRQKVSEL